jgi:hypothetical protein
MIRGRLRGVGIGACQWILPVRVLEVEITNYQDREGGEGGSGITNILRDELNVVRPDDILWGEVDDTQQKGG